MEIMEDSKRMSPQLAFSKWKKICDHDMRECEKDYLRKDSFIWRHFRQSKALLEFEHYKMKLHRESLKKLFHDKQDIIIESLSRLISSKFDIIISKLLSKGFTDKLRKFS